MMARTKEKLHPKLLVLRIAHAIACLLQELEWRIVRKYYSMAQQKAYRNCGRLFVALAGARYASALLRLQTP